MGLDAFHQPNPSRALSQTSDKYSDLVSSAYNLLSAPSSAETETCFIKTEEACKRTCCQITTGGSVVQSDEEYGGRAENTDKKEPSGCFVL